jgi:CRP-like cAMP-binding protein
MDLQPFLDNIAKHVNLTNEEVDFLLSKTIRRRYLNGQFVLQQGDIARVESYVLSGCLKTFRTDNDGKEHILMFAIEDWWTADLRSFITQTPSKYNIQCLEDCELVQISHNTIEDLYEKIPKLERFFRIIVQNAYVALQDRLVRDHSVSARERYLQFRSRYPAIEQRVPQYMIASYLGVTKEFLSKIRSQIVSE